MKGHCREMDDSMEKFWGMELLKMIKKYNQERNSYVHSYDDGLDRMYNDKEDLAENEVTSVSTAKVKKNKRTSRTRKTMLSTVVILKREIPKRKYIKRQLRKTTVRGMELRKQKTKILSDKAAVRRMQWNTKGNRNKKKKRRLGLGFHQWSYLPPAQRLEWKDTSPLWWTRRQLDMDLRFRRTKFKTLKET